MTETDPPPLPGREQLREEAAAWFTIMRGPQAEARRAEFEAWLARGALHRGAYSRIAETFSIGKGLDEADLPPGEARAAAPSTRPPRGAILAACALAILLCAGFGLWLKRPAMFDARSLAAADADARELATVAGEQRSWRLTDGSQVTLGAGSLLRVSYTRDERRLDLARGRARFDVAHGRRPFAVAAAGGLVIAHGTLFEVALSADRRVRVKLLRGSVEVRMPPLPGARPGPANVATLHPGEAVAFSGAPPEAGAAAPQAPASLPKDGLVDFDRVRLGDVVERANRMSSVRIVLAEPGLAALELSGAFRIDDTRALAGRLARLFDLDSEADGPTRIVLKAHTEAPPAK